MEVQFTDEQNMLREAFAEFAKKEVMPYAAEWDRESRYPTELTEKMGQIGILGTFVPEKYGGAGLGHVERAIALEEIARYSAGLTISVFAHQLSISAILDFGTEQQKQKYLPEMCAGVIMSSLATTEPTGGSDLLGQKSTAKLSDGKWTVNGRKCFITNSHIADVNLVTAKCGEDEKGRAKLAAFIIDKAHKGLSAGRKEHKLGLRSSVTGDLLLDHVEVGQDAVLGEPGAGAAIAMKVIGEVGRAGIGATCSGILRGCLEESVKFANEHIVYGKPISKLQAIQFHIAENRLDYETARLLLYRAASMKDAGIPATAEFAMAKHFGTEAAARASKRTIELMGGYGVIDEYPTGRFLRDSMAVISAGGTSEIQRIIIAADTLKKYA